MKINIIIPYRPLSRGFMETGKGALHQLSDGRWITTDGRTLFGGELRPERGNEKDELVRAIKFLDKNSYIKHNIIIPVDNDVYPNSEYFSQFDNVRIFRCSKIIEEQNNISFYRMNNAAIEGINSVSDDEWICHNYIADLICAKDWDKPIIDAIQQYGENYVYVPMFVEIRKSYNDVILMGLQSTPQLIWTEWRKLCCHALTMPVPSYNYVTEEDIDNYIKISNQGDQPPIIIEKAGDRVYGYFNVLIMKAKFAKKSIRYLGPGWDTDIDGRLYSECGLMKAVATRSFVFHPYCEFKNN